jgi:hypothetical protein
MHETKSKNVKGFLESNVYVSSEKYTISGWAANPNRQIIGFVLTDHNNQIMKSINSIIDRVDVMDAYDKNNAYLKSGFSIDFKVFPGNDKVFLNVEYDGGEIQTIFEIPILKGLIHIPSDISKINKHSPHLVVVDDFYSDPDAIRKIAMKQNFKPSGYHKGKRTETRLILDGTKEEIERILGRKIISWNQGYTGVFQYCTSGDPIVYHADSQTYAAVVYLTPDAPPETGTSFWRSKNNKIWRKPTEEDLNILNKDHGEAWHDMFGNPPNFYDGTRWELVDKIGNRYNRLAIWDAKLIHSASQYFGANIEDSRLFHMFFFDCK